eukprot:TRINITY_DN1738_c0_g2_i1.p1 TRINITY_DN1738_c0_g2~~TRINITY_DN1738_c0_g2_i1.p1  ORF type:complete len:822 (-),score=225.05 TRINITY_DN1738_c0_g2_i1:60-2525(-)
MAFFSSMLEAVAGETRDENNGQRTEEPQWLHGTLRIKVIRGRNIKNKDGAGLVLPQFLGNVVSAVTGDRSDPYVQVWAGEHNHLFTTTTKENNLNPEWNDDEDHYFNIAQKLTHLLFKLQDEDIGVDQAIGVAMLPVSLLVDQEEKGEAIAVVNRSLELSEGAGQLDVLVEYVPVSHLSKSLHIPNTYFNAVNGNQVSLYLNADDVPGITPEVNYAGYSVWEAPRLWRDVWQVVNDAREFVYVTGWAVNTGIALVREPDHEGCGETIGELFKRKADEGVRVMVLIWNDKSSTSWRKGLMGTHDEETMQYFEGTNVICRHAFREGDAKKQGIVMSEAFEGLFTHHQKTIIADGGNTGVTAFIGGIDLTDGRYDDTRYSLFRTINSDHKGDSDNHCFAVDPECGPRQPWHDLHAKVEGPAALDILQNFVERIRCQASDVAQHLVDLSSIGLDRESVVSRSANNGEWSVQLLRSIDERAAEFNRNRVVLGTNQPTFLDDDECALFPHSLSHSNGRVYEDSIHRGYVHMIRRAERFLYIENQYFLGSCYGWSNNNDAGATNIIPMEIALKIVQKIKQGERFAAYVLVPMYPEGEPSSGAVQTILRWQANTMEMMYKLIAEALDQYGPENAHPTDYLNFYCLGNRETLDGSQSLKAPREDNEIEQKLFHTRRMMVYVHSKGMIVDDEALIVGSANINQRSMSGSRDSEIAIAAYQPRYTGDEARNSDIAGYRLHLFSAALGVAAHEFREPESEKCVKFVNSIAEDNWRIFASNNVQDMTSYMMKYPVTTDRNGTVRSLPGSEFIPDSNNAPVLGEPSTVLPNILTT